ncbi:mediator complex subunit 13 C-terminal-domain-containing protein [Cunninghamella echinulata]|nr:mediator complex subunit 13 C-terminal-domain-containing protein [Cunninghamella echinulata]
MLSDSSLTNIFTVSGVSQIRYRAYQQCCSRSSLKTYFTQDPSASPTNQILLITAYKLLIEQNIPCMWQMQSQPKPSTTDMDIQPESLILELWVFWFDDRHTGLIDANSLLKDLEELRVGSFTWENVSLKNTPRSNACTLVTVVMEYKLFIKAVRNLIVPYMLKKGVLPLGDFFVFPPSYLEPAVGEGEDYNRSTLLCCTYNVYLASTNLIFQPNTRRIRIRHVTFSDIHTRAKALLSPTGEQAHLIPTKSHLSAPLEEQLLQQWAALLQLPLSTLTSDSDDLPGLICVRMSWGETILYPTRLIFLLTPTKQSPSSLAGMNGIMGYNHGLAEEIAQKWNREMWLNQIFAQKNYYNNGNNKHKAPSIDYWSYTSPRLNTTMTALDSLAASSLPSSNTSTTNTDNASSPSTSTLAPGGMLLRALNEPVVASPLMASKTVATPSSPLPRDDFDDDNDKNFGSNNGDTPGGGGGGSGNSNSISNNGLKNTQTSLLEFVQQYFTTNGSIDELSMQSNGNMELGMINASNVSTGMAQQQHDTHLIASPNSIQQQSLHLQQTNNNNNNNNNTSITTTTNNTTYQNTDLIPNISYSSPLQMPYNSASPQQQQSTPQQTLQQQQSINTHQSQTQPTNDGTSNLNNNNNNNNNSNNNNNGLDINAIDPIDAMVYDISTSWGDDSGLDNLGLELDVTEEDFNYFEDEPTKPVTTSTTTTSTTTASTNIMPNIQSMNVFQVKQEPMQQQQDMILDTLDFPPKSEPTMVIDSELEGLLDTTHYDGMVLDTPKEHIQGENSNLITSSSSITNPSPITIKPEITDIVQDQFSNIDIKSTTHSLTNNDNIHQNDSNMLNYDNINNNSININIKNEPSESILTVQKESSWPTIYGMNRERQLIPPSFAPIVISTPVNDAKYMYGGKFTYSPEENDHHHSTSGFMYGNNKNNPDTSKNQQQRRQKQKKDRTYRPDYIPIIKKKHLKKKKSENEEKDQQQSNKLLLDKDGDNIMMDATDHFLHHENEQQGKNDNGIQNNGRHTNGNNSGYDGSDSDSNSSSGSSNGSSSESSDEDDSHGDLDNDNDSMVSHNTNNSNFLQRHGSGENEKTATSSSLHKMIVEKELGEISNNSTSNEDSDSVDHQSLTSVTTVATVTNGYVDDDGLSHWLEGLTKAQTIYLHRLIADVKILQGGKRRYQLNKLDLDYDTPFASTVLPDSIHPIRYQSQDYSSLYTLCQQAALGGYPFTGGLAEVTASGGQVIIGESTRMLVSRRRDLVQNARGGTTHVPCLPCDFDLVTQDFKSILGDIFDPPTDTTDEPLPLNVTDFNSSVSVNGPLNVQQYYELSESNQAHSKYGKYQVKKRRPAEPNFDTLYTPDIVVSRHDEFIEGSPKMVDFWDKLRLEPYSAKKNISYFVICPNNDELESIAQGFFKGLSTVYETCCLGAHHPGNIGPYRRGIVPVPLLPEESGKSKHEQRMKSYMTVCENLGNTLGSALAENIYIVIYIVNPYPHLSSNLELSKCFTALKASFEQARLQLNSVVFPSTNSKLPSEKTRARLVMQLVPIEHIVRYSDFGGYTKNGLKEIAFSVYSKCLTIVNSRTKTISEGKEESNNNDKIMTPNSISSPSSSTSTANPSSSSTSFMTDEIYSPPFVLTKQTPDQITYSLKSSLKAPVILDQDATLHMAYGYSLDRRWMVIVWTDHRGELVEFAILRSSTRQGTPFISVFEEAWQRTKKIASQTDFPWTFVIVKLGLMFENELQAWVHVLPDNEKASIVSLDMESSLHVDTLNEQEESSHYYTPDTPNVGGGHVSTPPPTTSSSSSQNTTSSPSPMSSSNNNNTSNSNSNSGSGSGGGMHKYNIYHPGDHSEIFTTATTTKILLLNHRVAYSRKRQRISEGITLMEANSDPESWILPLASGYLIQVPKQGNPTSMSEEQFGRDPSVIELHLVYNQTPHSSYTALRDIIKRYYALSFVNTIPSAYNCLPLHIVLLDRIWRLLLVVDYS